MGNGDLNGVAGAQCIQAQRSLDVVAGKLLGREGG